MARRYRTTRIRVPQRRISSAAVRAKLARARSDLRLAEMRHRASLRRLEQKLRKLR